MTDIVTTAVIDGNHRVWLLNQGAPPPFHCIHAATLYRDGENRVLAIEGEPHAAPADRLPRPIVRWPGMGSITVDEVMFAYRAWLETTL